MTYPLRRWGHIRYQMKTFVHKVRNFLGSEDGPTAVEYAVMLALIVVICLAAISSVGSRASTTFNDVAKSLGAS
jgi:pilus assembly protein Flp/PilA